jgi:hypothetical protein
MTYEAPDYLPAAAIPACDTMSGAQRLRPRIAARSRAKITSTSTEPRGALAAANRAKLSSEFIAKRVSSRIAQEEEMAALCRRRASRWAEAIREGLDPDIASFVRSQAAAWELLATCYARSASDGLVGPADAH